MKKRSAFQLLTILFLILTACSGNMPAPVSQEDAVATAVATMLSGISTDTSLPELTVTLTPEPQTLLPRNLYYLAQDSNEKGQIFRLSRDGITITQITSEQSGVSGFDISPVDGTIAYIAENKLVVADASGANSQILTQHANIENLHRPTWAPVGKAIAYDDGRDVIVYSFDSGKSEVLFSGSTTDNKYPVSFSPDGRKLVIRKHNIPSSPESEALIYDFVSGELISLEQGESKLYPCFGYLTWNTSDTFFCHYHVLAGAVLPGLWRVNATDGSVETLITSQTSPFLLVAAPHQDDAGNLYYLYAKNNGSGNLSGFSFMRSGLDGQTDRVLVRPETFNILNALWTPDDSSLLIVQNNGENNFPVNIILVSVDPSKPVVTVMADASLLIDYSLRWGQ